MFSFVIFLQAVLALRPSPVCRNQEGQAVDWWFMYKESSSKDTNSNAGLRYLYFDSKMAEDAGLTKRYKFQPLSYKRLINDKASSPLLRTIYHPYEAKAVESKQRDTTVWIAVNDDPTSGNDAFGKNVTMDSGHVKFFTSAQVVFGEEKEEEGEEQDATIFSYLIQHSLPRFPNVAVDSEAEGILAHSLPPNPASIFDRNLKSKGQHFFCMSFRDEQKLDKYPKVAKGVPASLSKQLKYRKGKMGEYLRSGKHHFASILHYLKVTHAAVVATNYSPTNRGHSVYHQYLNVYSQWSSNPPSSVMNANLSRWELPDDGKNYDSTHLCPMWPLPKRVRINSSGEAYDFSSKNVLKSTFSQRNSNEAQKGVCRSWEEGTEDLLCLASATLTTTDRHFPLKALLLIKNQNVKLSPYDELLAPLVMPLADLRMEEDEAEGRMDVLLTVQSWVDFATMPEVNRELRNGGLLVNLKIANGTGIEMPTADGKSVIMKSQNIDHAKWALAVPRRPGSHAGLVAFSDLNRTLKHGHGSGRGGALLCFSSHVLTELMLSLNPTLTNNNADLVSPQSLLHLYGDDWKQEMVTAVRFASDKVVVAGERLPAHLTFHTFKNPLHGIESADKNNVAVPRITASGDTTILHGDIELKADEDEEIDPSSLMLQTVPSSPYLSGAWILEDRSTLATFSKSMLRGTTRFWALLQQSLHVAAGHSTSYTKKWLRKHFDLE